MSHWFTRSQIWQRYKVGVLLSDFADKAKTLLEAGCFVYFVREYCIEFSVCMGPSMLPTFNTRGDVLLLEHITTTWGNVRVGDVVLARSMQNPKQIVCKRVLGLEGDEVRVAPSTQLGEGRIVKVPPGHVWLQGDNTLNSTDSRHYGPVPYALIKGRAFLKVWPLHEAGLIRSYVPEPFGYSSNRR
ncbi:g10415 [Coccomyxa elongata]